MREIKFRAWDTWNKKMVNSEDALVMQCITGKLGYEWDSEDGGGVDYNEHLIPLQCTGLKDKNGKEIYDGDFLQNEWQKGLAGYLIEWCEGRFRPIFYNHGERVESHCYSPLFLGQTEDLIIIGNKFENPELLTGKAKGGLAEA